MNDVAASIGLANYPYVRDLVAKHKENARVYHDELRGVSGVTLPERRDGFDSSNWLFTILVENRKDFIRAMESAGIQVNQVHTRNDKYTALSQFKTELPQMDWIAERMICIPAGWWIDELARRQILEAIKRGW